MRRTIVHIFAGISCLTTIAACRGDAPTTDPSAVDSALLATAGDPASIARGQTIFRFDTFGDETFWTDSLALHEVIRTSVTPRAALGLGLKVDVTVLPASVRAALGQLLDDPAATVALLKLDAVVGVKGQVDASNTLVRVGITCALCHSTVDDSFAPGIGQRLDGWPNRDLDVGKIVTLSTSPLLTPQARSVYQGWGPGMYDPRFNLDGINLPVVMPPAAGLRKVAREIYTGDGPVSYWNLYVAVTQMHGHGQFVDPRIGVSKNNPPDLVSSKLDDLRAYQFSLEIPPPAPGTFDAAAAGRGHAVFNTAGCAKCHMPPSFTDVNKGILHEPAAVGQNPAYALRSATKRYRTTPLRGLWRPPQLDGPYFHDGHAKTLADVVDHYVKLFSLTLTAQQKADLIEYLKTL
ncbi:MAG TPA: c-type cytochrome [Gemmatimonadaceae bacterium]|nr:c-type cytochrome [Gemmatimonadaceae bacterium]